MPFYITIKQVDKMKCERVTALLDGGFNICAVSTSAGAVSLGTGNANICYGC